MALQSSQRLPELLFYTKKSYKILQSSNSSSNPTRAHYREFSIQNPILHTEDRELFEYYNSTHRRQGDLLEIHPCVLQDIPGNSSCSRDIQDIPVIHDLPAFQAILQCSSISRESTPFQHSPVRMHILHILQFYSSIGFHRKLHRVPVGQLQTLQTLHSKKGRCCDIGQIDRLFIIELFPLSSCQVIILIARMTFNCSTSCLMS